MRILTVGQLDIEVLYYGRMNSPLVIRLQQYYQMSGRQERF